MDINKIRDFNQKILAVFGILAIVLIVIIIIWVVTEYTQSYFRKDYVNPEIVSNEKAQENLDNNIRTHQVSFEELRLADTTNNIYLIPVSQSALKLEEFIIKEDKISKGTLGLMNSFSGYSDFYYGNQSYNNILIFNAKNNTIQKLFDNRISINRISLEKINGKSYALIAATDNDTNKDDLLNDEDSKTLYIFDLKQNKLNTIQSENTDFVDYTVIHDNEQLIIKYGLDKDKNGTYTWDEPMIMKSYLIQSNKLNDLISTELVNDLQNTLDGQMIK